MDARPRLHVTERARSSPRTPTASGRAGTATRTGLSKEGAHERLREKLEAQLDDEDRHARIIALGAQSAAGVYTRRGVDARFISQEAYDGRRIETMEIHFDD